MDQKKIDKYWELLGEYYQKAPDSMDLPCGYPEWSLEFGAALEYFKKGMSVDQIRRILDDVFTEYLGGSFYLDHTESTIIPALIHDWLNEVENPRTVDDFFGKL